MADRATWRNSPALSRQGRNVASVSPRAYVPASFFPPPALVRPGLQRHFDAGRSEEGKPSASTEAGILHHRDPNGLVVPAHPLLGHLESSGFGIRVIHCRRDKPGAKRAGAL